MKRKFITVQVKDKKGRLYLDDLVKINQIIKKKHPKIPKFEKTNKNPISEEDYRTITENTYDQKNPDF